jgi:predicted kinase
MKLQVLVGMIASGKSTYARNAARQEIICMNDDAIVNMLHADDYTLYDPKLKVLYKTVENQIIGTGLAMGKTVIVDRGLNVSQGGRQRWLALARSYDVPCEAILFEKASPEEHARRRAGSDLRGHDYDYWLRVATIHHDVYAPPTVREGFDTVHTITFDEICQGKVIK